MNKKDLKAVLLASALCGAAAVVPVMADEVEQDEYSTYSEPHRPALRATHSII